MIVIKFLLYSIVCYFISGFIHEFGHVIVGLINGWKFYILVVGPLGIKSDENGKIKFYFEKRITLWGGYGGTIPQSTKKDNLKIWSHVLLAGPLISIVVGAILLPIGIAAWNLFILLLGAMSISIGVMCIIPSKLKTGITYTDGTRWNRLRKGGQEADEEIALFKLMENQNTGGNLVESDYIFIESLINSKEKELKYYGYYYKYQFYKVKENETEMKFALESMEEMKSEMPSIIVTDCMIE